MVPQLPSEVEGLAGRLLECEADRVLLHRGLDRRAHLRGGTEESVGRDEAVDALVRAVKVVAIDEEAQPTLAVREIDEDGAREKLVPQRLPEALHFPQRLRMLRAALDVSDSLPLELGFELRLPPPGGVLATVVRQCLARHSEGCQPTLEGFHHQLRLLPVGDCVPDDKAAAVVHEDADVQPLVAPEQKGEDVRLPQLIRRGSLEASRQRVGLLDLGRPGFQQPLFVENPAHRRR